MKPRPIRTITPRTRDQFHVLTATATGLAAFGALVGTGYVAGHAAAALEQKAAQEPKASPPDSSPAVVTKRRPHRTVVRTVVVEHTVSGAAVAPASGGTIRSGGARPAATGTRSGTSGTSGTTSSASHHPPAAVRPAPAPAPAPAPSSGS